MKAPKDKTSYARQHAAAINVTVFLMAIAISVISVYLFMFWQQPLSDKPSDWGTLGDFIGGILNPVVAASALIWLIHSVGIQRRELEATRNELRETALAQQKAVEHQQTMKLINDCQHFSTMIERSIDIELENLGRSIAPPNGNAGLAVRHFRKYSSNNMIDPSLFQTTHSLVLNSIAKHLGHLGLALNEWRELHGAHYACYAVEYYKLKYSEIVTALYMMDLIPDTIHRYYDAPFMKAS